MKTSAVITNHALERMKERCGWSHKAAYRMAEKAFENGIRHADLAGSMERWVTKLYLSHGSANNVRIYGNNAFLFCGNVLITVVNVPKNFIPYLNEVRAKKEK